MSAPDGLRPPEPDGAYLTADTFELVRQYRNAKRSADMWGKFAVEVRDQVAAILGTARYGHYAGKRVVTVSRTRPRRFQTLVFKAEHPALYEQFCVAPDADEVRLILPDALPGDPPTAQAEDTDG
jgi:hypothetical protein